MSLKDLSLYAFELSNTKFEIIGEITNFTSMIWPTAYNQYSTFELWGPITAENLSLLKEDVVLWCGGENAVKIEIVQSERSENGVKSIHVKGRTLEAILLDRGNMQTYSKTTLTKASSILYELVDKNFINPTDVTRKIPYLVNATDSLLGNSITYQKTGGQIYDIIKVIAVEQDLGFKIIFDYENTKLIFTVYGNKDRSDEQVTNEIVCLSTDFDDILSSEYYKSIQGLKNVAFVHGEETTTGRTSFLSGETTSSGFNRKEMYVDARDLQSEVNNIDGSKTTLTTEQYLATLNQRGLEKLADEIIVETFDADLRTSQEMQYQYGVDYFLGDYITFIDYELGVKAKAQVVSVEEKYEEEYTLNIVFGISIPSFISKIKSMII